MKKRERERDGEDDGGVPQGKRAARVGESSAEANGGPPPARLTTDDALQYLKDVKEKFKDDKEKYNEFLEVMKDFKAHRVDTNGVIMRVKELFKGHRHLILGFNAFLPPGFEITLPVEERKQQPPAAVVQQQQQPQQAAVEFDQAINYVNKIKARFQADEHVYKAFLEILNMYRRANKNINEVYQEVALLFADHSDLLQEFTYFLPGTSNGATSHHQEHHHHHHPPPPPPPMANKSGLQPQRPREIAFGKPVSNGGLLIAKKEKIVGVPGRDREAERRAEKSRKGGEKKDIGDRKEGVDRVEGGREKEKDFFEQRSKRACARNATDAIRRQSQAGEGGEGFSGPGVQLSTDDSKAVKGAALQYPIFDKVKSRLRNRDTYQEFLKCLNIFSQEIISRVELQSLVGDILGKHTDLLEGFNDFLTHCENVEGYLAGVFSERKLGDFAEGAPLKVVKTERDGERDRNREKDRERDRERDRDRERKKEREKERIREKEKEKLREKERERERGVKERERDHGVKDVAHKVSSQKDKFVNKAISELDLSNCERCTPSYRLLPKPYPKPMSSHRTALGISVLNDNWVSVTSGSEDYSMKNARKNQHEESLFRCEDDRYELDMLLGTTAAAAKLVGQYTLKQEGESGNSEALPPLEEFLSPIHLRCIERIYGDHGLDILEVMKKSTSRAMPVIHSRLVQKEEEWTKCREEMNKVWSEVYSKNVYKALDHRSFNFKQQDKKALSTKSLLAEIKEMNEKRRMEDDAMLAIAAGNRRPLLPDFQHVFGDASIHDDLYQIIKYSSEEISSSPEHTEKTMRSLRTVLAPMLGISPRRHCEEDMEEASDGKGLDGNAMESGGGSEGDETSSPEGGGGGGLGTEKEVILGKNAENAAMERSRARALGGTDGVVQRLADGFERNVEECLVAENADIGVGDPGSEGANEVSVRGLGSGDVEGTAARTEGSGWLHAENTGRKQSCLAGERSESEARLNDGLVPDGNGNGVRDTVDREEGELSPSSEQEDRNKVKCSPRRMGIEENGVKICQDREEVDAEAVGVNGVDHDQDANDKREASAQKSSEDSDNPSEVADESSASEQSSDEQSEHEEDEDEQEEKVESEGEAEDMADADDGDEDGNSLLATQAHTYAHCKPLAVYPASATASQADSHSKAAGRVFYGNDMSYILSRLYQTLYERILSAKVHAESAGKKKCSDGGAAPNLYSRFMQVLYGLLDGSLDNSKFEDECREIIGTQSYVLFTLDKLIFMLVKQLQAAAADEGVQKLLALNAYEYEREAVDLVYYADACVVLHDENLYRFENKSNSTVLLIQLMENSEKLDFPGNALGSPFQKYLDEFTKSAPTRTNQIIRRILKRKYAGEEQDVVIERALVNTKVVNGLENKISCRTSKVSYVLDTEDLFFRGTHRRSCTYKQKRVLENKQIFGVWLDKASRILSDSASESSISR